MDSSILSSPLETNLNRLIHDQFSLWSSKFNQFLEFTDRKTPKKKVECVQIVIQLERGKAESLDSFKKTDSFNLPEICDRWIKSTSSSSSAFVSVCVQDFRPKLAKQVVDIEQEQRDSLACLKEAAQNLQEPSEKILAALSGLHDHFTSKPSQHSIDPWLNELTVRHFSARFLDSKSNYLEILHKIYLQTRHLSADLELKMSELSAEFLTILERFSLSCSVEMKSPEFPTEFHGYATNELSTWQSVLKTYSLDYDWKLQCPPLDGFLSTLFTHLKSLGVAVPVTSNTPNGLPQIFPESVLKFGFLQKSVSGLLSRSWQVLFAIFQPNTGHLHLYKVNTIKSVEGNLLVPSSGTTYTKASLHDLNLLAAQFFLSSPHQPAAISPQTLTPLLSINVKGCKAVASDPTNFTFSIRAHGEKFNLRAFCEEEFVNWVIFLNEQNTQTQRRKSTPLTSSNQSSFVPSAAVSEKSSSSPSAPESKTFSPNLEPSESQDENSPSLPQVHSAPVVDLENPWN